MTQQEFQEAHAKMTGISWAQLEKQIEAVPCTCGKKHCPGWQMIKLRAALVSLETARFVECKTRWVKSRPMAYNW
jgi:hypothetical protein